MELKIKKKLSAKNKIILSGLFTIIFLSQLFLVSAVTISNTLIQSINSNGNCYQENSNNSNIKDDSCNLNYSGFETADDPTQWESVYVYPSIFTVGDLNYLDDGNMTTYDACLAELEISSCDQSKNITFIKPLTSIGGVIRFIDTYGTNNIQIPDDCWSYDSTSIKIKARSFRDWFISATTGDDISCQNGSDSFHLLINNTINQDFQGHLNEISVNWNMTSYLNINCSGTYYADFLDIENDYINFQNFSRDNGLNKISFNVNHVYKNYTCDDLPYFSSNSDKEKIISNNITDLNVSLFTSVLDCSNIGTIKTSNNQIFQLTSCSGNQIIILNNLLLTKGNTILDFNYNGASIKTCNNFFGSGNAFIDFIIILIIIGIAIFVIFMIDSGSDGGIDLTLLAGIVIIALVVMSMGMIIINAISGC